MIFSEHVHIGRINKGLKKSELARRLGITAQYLADIERGSIPSEDVIERMIGVLDLDEVETFKLADKLPIRVLQKAKFDYFGGHGTNERT